MLRGAVPVLIPAPYQTRKRMCRGGDVSGPSTHQNKDEHMRGAHSFEDEEESGIHLFGFLSCSPSESISDALWKVGKRVNQSLGGTHGAFV